ncbi:MAG: hypothetical protein R3E65_02760 [Steroidobacteraceae bacterium]
MRITAHAILDAVVPLAAAALLLASPAAHSQRLLPAPQLPVIVPPAATQLAPAGTVEGTTGNRTPLVISWSHKSLGGLVLTAQKANYFVVCFEPESGGSTPRCGVATAAWTVNVSAPTAGFSRSGARATLDTGTFVDSTQTDRLMRLSIGSCRALSDSTCTFASSQVYFSTINPIAAGAGESPGNSDALWMLDVRARNSGTSPVPALNGVVYYDVALGAGSPGRTCRTDVDAADVRNDADIRVHTVTGTYSMSNLPRNASGAYQGPAVVGMSRISRASVGALFSTPFNPSLPAALGPDQPTPVRGIATVSFPVAANGLQDTYVVTTLLDTGNQLREFNEQDNLSVQCKRR